MPATDDSPASSGAAPTTGSPAASAPGTPATSSGAASSAGLDMAAFRDPALGRELTARIADVAPTALEKSGGTINLMEVCGTHTVALARAGIRSLLPDGINLTSGPGCPVCVTANADIDSVIALAKMDGVITTTFGDMMRVPGSTTTLNDVKAAGHDVRVVYSPLDALRVATDNPDNEVVFIGVGFETTIPLIASVVRRAADEGIGNFSVFTAHKTVPTTLETLVNDPDVRIDGLILPGHVSTIIGMGPYRFLAEKYGIPGVIMGFEPVDLLSGILMLLEMIAGGEPRIVNDYRRGVSDEGNVEAQRLIAETFEPADAAWRGMGTIPDSGLVLREEYRSFDAIERFHPEVEPTVEPRGCRCGDVLRGVMSPKGCPLFARACSPEHPVGPCMVSSEGSCAAYYKYLR